MKKGIIALLVLTSLLGACQVINEGITSKSEIADFTKATNVKILTDSSTGCKYVIIDEQSNDAKMTPLYGKDGRVQGCGK